MPCIIITFMMKTDIVEKITAKQAEIANYERILQGYRGRWYDQGRRHLEELKAELSALEHGPLIKDEPLRWTAALILGKVED